MILKIRTEQALAQSLIARKLPTGESCSKQLCARLPPDFARKVRQHHRNVRRPWGFYDLIDHGDRFQVKRIVVMPGARLSLQIHHHRAEHWVVVNGTALVTRGAEQFLLGENESTYVSLGITPSFGESGCVPFQISEVQSASDLTTSTDSSAGSVLVNGWVL